MADHAHKQIRDALVTALTGLTTSGSRVYANRLHPMAAANLPGLRVFARGEKSDPLTVHAPQQQARELVIDVECCAKATADLDDVLDLMSKEVETALAAGIAVTGTTLDAVYQGMQMDLEGAAQEVGVKRLRFAISFETANNAPDVFI